jgi:selenocysteine-specific elongation factor
MTVLRQVIVGTAGHIDHGKSALVEALTGIHPDRLAEEQERGMTIDLGFAPYVHGSGALVGMIDVPGHERFIKNMVAGATSVDVVLLVVAADDGVMPQTREHLAILELLGVQRGLVALNKVDLVEPALVELARQDVAALLAGSFLADAPVLSVSAITREGLPELRAALDALIVAVPARDDEGPFRLPVQRVFSARGHGTVVTGVPVSGRVVAGDALEVVGRDLALRPQHRAQRHRRGPRRRAPRRRRGHARRLRRAPPPLRALPPRGGRAAAQQPRGAPARRHGRGAGRGRGAGGGRGGAGRGGLPAAAPARARRRRAGRPLPAASRRQHGRAGRRHRAGRHRRAPQRVLGEARERLAAQGDPARLARVALAAAGRRGLTLADLALETGVPAPSLRERLEPLLATGELLAVGPQRLVEASSLEELGDELHDALRAEHKAQPLLDWADLVAVRRRCLADDELLAALLARDARFETSPGGRVRLRGWRARLTEAQRQAHASVLAALRAGGATPPPVTEALTGLPEKETRALLFMLRAAGEVQAVGELWFAADVLQRLRDVVMAHGRARGGAIDIPALRDELGTTRKYLIPLLEHFDATGLTVRHGERRTLRHVEGAP